jgi:hypothetical protein
MGTWQKQTKVIFVGKIISKPQIISYNPCFIYNIQDMMTDYLWGKEPCNSQIHKTSTNMDNRSSSERAQSIGIATYK